MAAIVDEFPGNSDAVKRLREELQRAAQTLLPVMLIGERGSGKELAARALHSLSNRRDQAFVAVTLAAIPDILMSAELVGHTKRAFTGADRDRPGLFERAQGGTILLDEIGEASPNVQSLLLSVLESGSVRRPGAGDARTLDIWIIAATTRDLRAMSLAGEFRADLLSRLSAIQIKLPSLRERRSDIPLLASSILERISKLRGLTLSLTPGALESLQHYDFPGNFRELANLLERAAFTSKQSAISAADLHLPRTLKHTPRGPRLLP
jgi:DNA-binding NtrC family response regulator